MHLPVHGAAGLMGGADRLATAGALRRLVHTHPLVAAAFTAPQARRTQPALPLWGLRVTLLGVAVADDPPAAATRRQARRARRMAVLGADPLVGRAVLQSARRAEPHVLVTRRLTVHATLEQPMVRTEVFGADRTAVRASVTAAVVVPADDEGRGRSAALWTRHDPRGGTAEGALRGECRVTPPGGSRLELPLRALHQDASLDELQWMHDGLHPAAPHLFGAAALGARSDGAENGRASSRSR